MSTLLDVMNSTREETISTHYGAASAELTEKIKLEPLRTTFHIYAGCVSKDVANEIACRFNRGGVKAIVGKTGMISTQYFLTVEVNLPENLHHHKKQVTPENFNQRNEQLKSEPEPPLESALDGEEKDKILPTLDD